MPVLWDPSIPVQMQPLGKACSGHFPGLSPFRLQDQRRDCLMLDSGTLSPICPTPAGPRWLPLLGEKPELIERVVTCGPFLP